MAYQLFRFLDTNGDGTGTKSAIADYPTVPGEFKIDCPQDNMYLLERAIVHIEDVGSLDSGGYGNGAALVDPNGVQILHKDADGNTVNDLTDGLKIHTNGEWARFCYDVQLTDFGAGNNYVTVRWTFGKTGAPLRLQEGHSLVVTLLGNFTGLVSQTFMVQGTKRNVT